MTASEPPSADEDSPRSGSRHSSRKLALDILYEADLIQRPLAEVLASHLRDDPDLPEFAIALVRGVHRYRDEIDALIEQHSTGWKLSRMPVVDRNVMRVAMFELRHTDVPAAVAIDEAVELVKELSTADSPRFVNGLLARAAGSASAGT